jgi:hypothetical protein
MANLTDSQKQSAYFAIDSGYDKEVYENDLNNWFKIIGMISLFYLFNGLHWWANLELALSDPMSSTIYNLCIFGLSVLVIGMMLYKGSEVNKMKMTHEFYIEKISEVKQRLAEQQSKEAAKAAQTQMY